MARIKAFDTEEVLDKAVQVFWEKGYEAASIQDLVEAMRKVRKPLCSLWQ